ncbi:hypothetical protein HNP46_000098 [Pseudomonas nitritireducens]|uniref:Uncharacterized protein n=1 Tax=Pseudomonas nitroreducens TaxID=46680 RepID=A0A7W7KEC5_PSENT|nr:hypothetical protein [Pseudomonas nitritireducens]MBB4861287.1 hypothetical protein [Pseudomonas nitritireducens]
MDTVNGPSLEILQAFVRFAEGEVHLVTSAGEAKERRRTFLESLQEFNTLTTIRASYPLFFIPMDDASGGVLSQAQKRIVVDLAVEEGIDQHIKVVHTTDGSIVHFSRHVRDQCIDICKRANVGWADIGKNGLVLNDFVVTGLSSATRETLSKAADEARAAIKKRGEEHE